MFPLELDSVLNGVNKLLCFPLTKSISYVERQDLAAVEMMLLNGCDCDYDDVDDCDKEIPGTSCGDLYLLLDFGLSGIHPPAVIRPRIRKKSNNI